MKYVLPLTKGQGKEDHGIHKLPKKLAVYVEPGQSTTYKCSECMMWLTDQRCTAVRGTIRAYGSCNFWMKGPPASPKNINKHRVSKAEAGYTENKAGFSCARCDEFHPEKKKDSCTRVMDETTGIKPGGCCNVWEAHPIRSKK